MSYAINTIKDKNTRKDKINCFVLKFGRGDTGLTSKQKMSRVEKILGTEKEKLKGFGINDVVGVELFTRDKHVKRIDPNFKGHYDPIPEDVKDNFESYPDDPYRVSKDGKSKVLNVIVRNDGGVEMDGIHLTGTEKDVRKRISWNVLSMSDRDLFRLEKKQSEQGTLKEVSDRTMKLHEENGTLDSLFESDTINTDEDRDNQY